MTAMMIGVMTVSVLVSIIASVVAFCAWVELKSFMKSTHKIEYIPFEPPVGKDGKPKSVESVDPLKEYGII